MDFCWFRSIRSTPASLAQLKGSVDSLRSPEGFLHSSGLSCQVLPAKRVPWCCPIAATARTLPPTLACPQSGDHTPQQASKPSQLHALFTARVIWTTGFSVVYNRLRAPQGTCCVVCRPLSCQAHVPHVHVMTVGVAPRQLFLGTLLCQASLVARAGATK